MDQQAIEGREGRAGLARRAFRMRDVPRTPAERRVFEAVEAAFDIGRRDLRAATRGRCEISFARQTGMYLARVVLGMTLLQAARLFGRDRTTASHACRVIEDLRDDPAFDALLSAMEAFVLQPESADGRASR
jgi:chromosomal replication initiation ATPase DnaA